MNIIARTKTYFIAALALFVLLALTPSSAMAQSACDSQVQQIQSNYSQAMKVRNQGMHAQVVVRNDSSLQLSCFDQAMALTSTAGQIFSDSFPDMSSYTTLLSGGFLQPGVGTYALPPPLGKMGVTIPGLGISLPIPGMTDFLMFQINNTVEDTLNSMLAQFLGNLLNQLSGLAVSMMTNIMTEFFSAMIISYGLGSITSFFSISINMTPIMQSLIKMAMTAVFGSPKQLNCPTMQTAWTNGAVGMGVTGGSPYFTVNGLLGGATTASWPGSGTNMNIKYSGPGNRNILLQAGTDQGVLVSTRPSHPPVPVLPPLAKVSDVISAM